MPLCPIIVRIRSRGEAPDKGLRFRADIVERGFMKMGPLFTARVDDVISSLAIGADLSGTC